MADSKLEEFALRVLALADEIGLRDVPVTKNKPAVKVRRKTLPISIWPASEAVSILYSEGLIRGRTRNRILQYCKFNEDPQRHLGPHGIRYVERTYGVDISDSDEEFSLGMILDLYNAELLHIDGLGDESIKDLEHAIMIHEERYNRKEE